MARMLDQWQIDRENARKIREENLVLEEKNKFLLEHSEATREDLLGIMFDYKKRLEKLENKLNCLLSQSQSF